MPAFALSNNSRVAGRYDVIGTYSESSDKFVTHVAQYNEETGTVDNDQDVGVVHMRPPFELFGKTKANAIGTVPLTNEERREIETWISEEVEDEYKRWDVNKLDQYHIHPPWKDVRDRNRPTRRYRKYSCAGFVIYAYGQVEIDLLAIEEKDLPEVSFETLSLAYDPISRGILKRFGVTNPDKCHIVLPGYVLHALNRSDHEIRQGPYVAQPGDERFG